MFNKENNRVDFYSQVYSIIAKMTFKKAIIARYKIRKEAMTLSHLLAILTCYKNPLWKIDSY